MVILDDFKTALDRLRAHWLRKQLRNGEIALHGLPAVGERDLEALGREAVPRAKNRVSGVTDLTLLSETIHVRESTGDSIVEERP